MSLDYDLKANKSIEAKVTFIRLKPKSLRGALLDILNKLSDLSWIDNLTKDYLKASFIERARPTIESLSNLIEKSEEDLREKDEIVSSAAEYVVSVMSNEAVVKELSYKEIPLPEVFKHQRSQNPGFDFFSINNTGVLLFGEAKFVKGTNAYGNALKQIVRFIEEKNDIKDLADLQSLVDDEILGKVTNGEKGYIAGFSSTNIETDKLVNGIKRNDDYLSAKKYEELVLVAVDMM